MISCLLVLGSGMEGADDQTLARLGFWVPVERMTEFEAAYEKQMVPIFKRHGLKEWSGPVRATADSVFARVFVFDKAIAFSETYQALLADPAFQKIARNLGYTFGRFVGMDFRIYRSRIGSGKRVVAGSGQGYWRTYRITEGLAGSQIVSIFQDREKVIWFGSFGGGLTRYDGESFTIFTTQDGLANDRIRSIVQDRKGDIWIGIARGGVSRYHTQAFMSFTTQNGQIDNRVSSIV